MTNEELRAQLDEAKEFKAARITEAKYEVERAKAYLSEANELLNQWSAMIPHQVLDFMAEESRRKAAADEAAKQLSCLEALHTEAIRQANEKHKGMLPPHAASKSITFGMVGGTVGGLLAIYVASFHFGLHNEIGILLVAIAGGIGGLFIGFELFSRNFVVDDSLERSPFDVFSARDTVRRTYFKNSRD